MHSVRYRFFFSRSRERATAGSAVLLITLSAAGCTGGGAHPHAASRPRILSADSTALLAAALRQVRPAFETQDEALRRGAYAAVMPLEHSAPPRASAATTAPSGRYVIQIAAYREREAAEIAATAAGSYFPELEVRIEAAGEQYRVALGAWPAPTEARSTLRSVQRRYPDAWLRRSAP